MEKIEFLDPRFARRGEEFRVGALREREEELAALDRLDSDGEDFRCRPPPAPPAAACRLCPPLLLSCNQPCAFLPPAHKAMAICSLLAAALCLRHCAPPPTAT